MMRSISLLFAIVSTFAVTAQAELTRQECTDQGGIIVGDIGNGAIFQPSYLCDSNGLPPIDVVVPLPNEPIASEGEVCCGGPSSAVDVPQVLSEEDCTGLGGSVVEDVVTCPDQQPPLGTIDAAATATARQSTTTTTALCCPPEISIFPPPPSANRDEATRQECTVDLQGIVVGDIGNGAIFSPDYICESNGQPPIANIVQPGIDSGEPIAIEGEVCCGQGPNGQQQPPPPSDIPNEPEGVDREEATRQECTDELDGEIVGDIGDGATRREDYLCPSGQPPLANIVPVEGEPIAREGEVCCGQASMNQPGDIAAVDEPGDSAGPQVKASHVSVVAAASAILSAIFM